MSYIGNQVTSVPHVIDTFSGNAFLTSFGPLVRAPAGTASIAVFISGVYKTPGLDYTLDGNYINFTSAPPVGSDNIVVHHLGNGTTSQTPSDGSVTGTKLAINSVRGNNIVAGTITGNLIGSGAISGNQIGTGAISGNQIGLYAISGNQIGTGAISANNFAGGGITSNVLASNLTISTVRLSETINLVTSGISGNYNVHVSNSTVYYFVANTTANVTFNLIANNGTATGTTGTLNDLLSIGQSASVAVLLKQGSTRYRANVYVDGVLQTCYWLGNSQPLYQESQPQSIDSYNFVVVKTGSSAYTVLASNSAYSQANGQGIGGATQ